MLFMFACAGALVYCYYVIDNYSHSLLLFGAFFVSIVKVTADVKDAVSLLPCTTTKKIPLPHIIWDII